MPDIVIKSKADLSAKPQRRHAPYAYDKYEITDRSQFNQCYAAFYDVPPLQSNYPFHYHENNTELFYIISGTGLLRTPDGELPVQAGDVIVFPPGKSGAHKLTNTSPCDTLSYLDVDTTNSPDITHYPDSGKIGIIKHNESSTFYQVRREADYYTGE